MSCLADCCVLDCLDCGFCCIFDSCSDHGCSYHPDYDDKTVENTVNTANELAEMRERANREGKELGEEVFQNINIYMNQFLEYLERINQGSYGGKQLNIDMDAINKDVHKMKKTVKEFIGDKINERLVLTDAELTAILEERDDQKRTRKFNDFYVQVHKGAVRDLIDYIQKVIAGEFNMVAMQIRNRLDEVEQSIQEARKSYKDAEQLKKAKSASLAEKQVEAMYRIALAEIMMEELRAGA